MELKQQMQWHLIFIAQLKDEKCRRQDILCCNNNNNKTM
jgi:hypothetical protein